MKLNELILKDENELSIKQLSFLEVHSNIMTAGNEIVNSIVTLAQNLKRMKEEKLFIEAGFATFEEYTENACGLKKSQAYSYIQVLEKLGADFVRSSGKIGIKKLTLLAPLSDDEKDIIIEKNNIEDISVKELKVEIQKLKDNIKNLKNKPPEIKVQEDTKSKEKVKELQEKLKSMTEQFKAAEEQYKISSGQAADLRKQLTLNTDKTMIEFKVKFEALQTQIVDIVSLIDNLSEEKKEGCRNALKKVVEVLVC